jgi:hypothetical protein
VAVWSEACERAGVSLLPLPQDEGASAFFRQMQHDFMGIQFSDTKLLININMKMKIMHAVQSSYGFDTSRAPDSIGHNTRLAHALLTNMTFIYRVRPIAQPFDSTS